MEQTFSTLEVMAHAGVSFRQLDYLVRSGRVPGMVNPGSGKQRRFTLRQRDEVARIARARRLARRLEDLPAEVIDELERLIAV